MTATMTTRREAVKAIIRQRIAASIDQQYCLSAIRLCDAGKIRELQRLVEAWRADTLRASVR
mgnify:CR=1 FL=1